MKINKYLVFSVEDEAFGVISGKISHQFTKPEFLDLKKITIRRFPRYDADERPAKKKESRFKPKLGRDIPPLSSDLYS